jgi:prepilin-type N-terminal cleavage/methylation domain-containing protein
LNRDLSLRSSVSLLPRGQAATHSQQGFTLLETMIALGMSGVVIYAITSLYLLVSASTYDQKVQAATNLQVQALMQTIGSDLRALGNGVPFDQPRFDIGEEGISDMTVADPISPTDCTANKVVFRLNETGEVHLLTADFDPLTSTSMALTGVDDLAVGDPIYLNDSVVSGDDGLYGEIDSIDSTGKTITLNSSKTVYNAPAIFKVGTIFEPVPLITYESNLATKVVSRTSGSSVVVMAKNTTVTFAYISYTGAALTLPLTRVDIISNLRSIKVTIQAEGENKLSSGETYTAVAQQTFALRNLNYNF